MNRPSSSTVSVANAASSKASWHALVAALGLEPHPEGGHYRELFRSKQTVSYRDTQRSAGTSIYYLLAQGAYSAWHRIDADETWYFHAGTPLAIHVIDPNSDLITHYLGNPLEQPGAAFQVMVPAGHWFAAELTHADNFALVGCAVAPGFEFSGFELANEAAIAAAITRHGAWIRRLL